jgi:hypothetical protein
VLPQLTPATTLGSTAVAAYAKRQGVSVEQYLTEFGPTLSTEQAGKAISTLITDPGYDRGAYVLTAAGLAPAP